MVCCAMMLNTIPKTLSELCHLQANWLKPERYWKHGKLSRGYSSEAFETPLHSTLNFNVAPPLPLPQSESPPNLQQPRTAGPWNTLEVRGIPKGVSKEEVQARLKAASLSRSDIEIDVRSLVAYSERECCATFIVPQEDWREENLLHLPSGWTIDDQFFGITPLYDGSDIAEVESVFPRPYEMMFGS